MATLGFIQNIGTMEWLIILALGLVIFGRRLPEVGRSLGRSIVEFKKGLKGVEDEIDTQSAQNERQPRTVGERSSNPSLAAASPAAPAPAAPDLRVSRSDTVD